MPDEVAALMHANLTQVFGERDPAAQAAAAERTFTPDVTFTDDQGTVVGLAAVVAKARGLLAEVPADFVFTADSPLYVGAGDAALAWTFGPSGGEPAVRGIDIATIVEGRISVLRTLLVG